MPVDALPVRLARRISFSSGHRYWFSSRSADENRSLFGRWASPYNHGHNYVLEVTAEGHVVPENGMVVNIKEIDDVLRDRIKTKFDQRSINDEVPEFGDLSPTVENLLLYIRNQLHDLPGHARLVGLKLEETPLLYGEWHAGQETPLTITRVYEFAASHRLHAAGLTSDENLALFGKCNNPAGHGHNYMLEVTVGGQPDERTGMLVDIEALDRVVNEQIVDRYDHRNLNQDLPEFAGKNPTSEVVALQIFASLKDVLPAKLVRVRLHETARNVFEVQATA
jgi:6-pyruvoyltetrahydropterin/6-carboxytetrahydropterin synthase